MARISKELSDTKQAFVLGLFAVNPTLTIREVQEKLKEKFTEVKGGSSMNPRTILNLRGGTTPQTSPIVSVEAPAPVEVPTTTIGDLVSPNYSAITDTDPTPPTPVVQVAAPKPVEVITPVEGETFRVVEVQQVTDANGTHITTAPAPTPTES